MSMEDMKIRLSFVINGDDAWRLSFKETDGALSVWYDAHEKTVPSARRDISNIAAMVSGRTKLNVIHGYNNGTAIKQMLRTSRISNRVLSVSSPAYNPGITQIELK